MLSILLVCVILVAVIWQSYYGKNWNRHVKIAITFQEESVYAGEETKLIEVIENHKKMPVPVLEVGFHTKKELVFQDTDNINVSDNLYKRDIFSVMGWQKITRQIQVKCTKRGWYHIEDADLISFSLLHDRKYNTIVPINTSLYVYPAIVKVEELVLICESLCGTVQCAKHLYEDPFAFRSIREYTTQDPFKTVNWKSSAKAGKLMVNTYDSALIPKVILFLDVEDSGILKHDDLIEESISVVASIARKLLKQGMEVGFYCNGKAKEPMCIPLSNRKNQIFVLERMLACYQSKDGNTDFGELLTTYQQKQKTVQDDIVYVFVSKNAKQEMGQKMQQLVGKSGQGLWICPVSQEDINKGRCTSFPQDNVKFVCRGVEKS